MIPYEGTYLVEAAYVSVIVEEPGLRYGNANFKHLCNELAEIVNAVLILSSSTNNIGLSKHSLGAKPIAWIKISAFNPGFSLLKLSKNSLVSASLATSSG